MTLPKNLILRGFLLALAAVVYIVGISFLIFNDAAFSNGPIFLGPVLVLMLLVFSVAVMGVLFFLGPIWLYMENKKKDALKLLAWIFVWFFIFLVSVFLIMIIANQLGWSGQFFEDM